jgi:carotenoid cleavage dioxygenase-like enzyme
MHTSQIKSTKKLWAKALGKPAREFSLTALQILSGKIPEGLRGTLYRNGPARLERGGIHVGHWFDGDGAILAIYFTDAGAKALYRYVQTAGYQEEIAAGRLLYGNYGMTASGFFWNRWSRPIKNSANTNVLALPDKLLALWEGGKPHALDLQNLTTWGEDNLNGLTDGLTYSAHYKRNPHTGEIFNFGVTVGLNATLNIYKSDSTGKIVQKAAHQINGIPILHDFVFVGRYLVFCIPPVRLNILPTILGISTYSDALEWKPQLGTQILVVDSQTLEVVSRGETEPWFQWHFANGYVDDSGLVILDVVRYEDFQTNQYLKEVATGETHTAAKGTLWRINLNPQTGKVTNIHQLFDQGCEFPIIPPHQLGQNWDCTYLAVYKQGTDISKELLNGIARFDYKSETLTEADLGENRYPSEPIYVSESYHSEQGWVITVVYDGNSDSSEVWVFSADRLHEEPVCKLGLPSVIPHSFHGTWKPAG